jgi:pheromone shutdown protein TraB
VRAAQKEIKAFKPGAVALELDMPRFVALTRRARPQPRGLVQMALMELQKRAAQATSVRAGAEMMAAAKAARKAKIPVVLIDRDIRITLNRAIRSLTLKEKLKLGWGVIAAFFEVGDAKKLNSLLGQKDELMAEFKREFPGFYHALVTERDEHMAGALHSLPYGRVVVVVGAGHLTGVRKNLEYWK